MQSWDAGVLRGELTAVQGSRLQPTLNAAHLTLAVSKREAALLKAEHQLAKRELPDLVKQRTAEDNLWLALASLTADKRLQLQVLQVHTNGNDHGEADRVAVAFKVLLLPSFFAQAADAENKHDVQQVFDGPAQVLLYHLINDGAAAMSEDAVSKQHVEKQGQCQADEADLDAMSNDEEEVQEEVAEAVQSARKERLRDDLLGMVCPSDWTIQAPEPPGLKLPLHAYQRHALAWMSWRERVGGSNDCIDNPSSSQQDSIDSEAAGVFGLMEGGLHPCWQPVTLPSGLHIFENRYTGQVTQKPPPPPPPLPGGILGDEMGLGKTAEMHALMVARPRPTPTPSPTRGPKHLTSTSTSQASQRPSSDGLTQMDVDAVFTSQADVDAERVSSGKHAFSSMSSGLVTGSHGTHVKEEAKNMDNGGLHRLAGLVPGSNLVVCPMQLKDQWINEVAEKHGSLKVVVYEGLKWQHRQAQEDSRQTKKSPPNRNKAARMAWAQDQWEKLVQVSSGEAGPSFDPQQEASDAVQQLQEADVVLTSYEVLRQEVHYSPEGARLHSLRRAKKYVVPESPLLSVSWWRVVLDEAQMVGTGLSSVAVMAGRLHSTHRWAVTGTPIGPGGLDDIQGLLKVLHHDPFCDPLKWKWCVANPYLTGEKGSAAQLARVLRPIMWRNSKRSSAGQGLDLPPRTLTLTRLHFTPAEHTFYSHILEKTREARDALHHHEHQSNADSAGPSTASPNQSERRRVSAASQARKLFEGAEREVRQLRLACIHPQMTAYWRNLSAELQLDSGGALSMGQIMQRLLEGVQAELQAKERDLCAHLNAQAHLLILEAHLNCLEGSGSGFEGPDAAGFDGTGSGKGKQAASATESLDEPFMSDGTVRGKRRLSAGSNSVSPASKKRRRSQTAPPGEDARAGLLSEALHLLQRSQAVGESGIEALNGEEGVQELDNNIVGADATIKAWRFMQANTAHQLAEVYEALGNAAEAAAMRLEVQAKVKDVREVVDESLAKAAAKSVQSHSKADELRAEVLAHWQEAGRQGWLEANVRMHEWVQGLQGTFQEAQSQERQAREEQTFQASEDRQQTLMGTHVIKALQAVERQLLETRSGLEGLVGKVMSQQALQRLKAVYNQLAGSPDNRHPLGPPPFLQQLPDRALPWRALCMPDSPALMPSAAALHASQTGLLPTQAALRKTIRAIEKQLTKFQKQAEEWGEHRSVAGYSLEACAAGLAGVRGQLELARALREVHTQEVRQELAQFEVDSVEAEVMTAAQARVGEGPLRAAEGKEPKALQSEVAHLMNVCEKLRARKRFFANKVEEINPKANARQTTHGPGSSPDQPLDDAGAAVAQPFQELGAGTSGRPPSAAASHTSFPNYTPHTSVSPTPADQLIESWVVSPPTTPAVTPPASPPATTSNPKANDLDNSTHGTGKADAATNDAAAVSSVSLTSGCNVTADTHGAAVSDDHVTVQEAGLSTQVRQESQHAQQHATRSCLRQSPSAANESSIAQQHGSPPTSGVSIPVECHHDVTQQSNRRPIGLTWADGVRAPLGMALAIGPWAHTSSFALPVATQAFQHDDIHLASSSGHAHMAGLGPHDRDAAVWEGGLSCIGIHSHEPVQSQHASASIPAAHAGVHDDQVMLASHAAAGKEAAAATATEAVREAQTREMTPDDDSSSSQMCNVCLCPIRQLIIVLQPCGHYYCENCTAAIRAVAYPRCPECRTRISSTFRVPLSSAQTQTHKEDPQHAQINVVGNWMSKIEGLIRRIVRLRQVAPEEKSLVFSQYPDALKLVGKALHVNNISWVELKGGSKASAAIREFETKEEVRVFLLPHKVGASGLTLNRANHVFLLEPSMDPAILQQAVGRAHRMGQTRPVHVTRLIMHSTVEEAVMEAQERRQPLMELAGVSHVSERGLAGQQVAKQEAFGQQDLQHLLDAVLPATHAS
ncbi:hypothetical protein WJX77_007371 [Trebouxia sp. C0004]